MLLRRPEPARSSSDKELTRQRIRFGFLFQKAALFDSMTDRPERRLSAAAAHAQDAGRQIQEIVRRAPGGGRPAGQRARARSRPSFPAACGNASAWPGPWRSSPELMLYDEPTTGLDPIMSDVINELILQHAASTTR